MIATPETSTDRFADATQLVEDFNLQQDAEFFSDPENRLDFLTSLNTDEFIDLTQHVNARLRGYEPREQINAYDKGGFLPTLGTPSIAEKPEAFKAGFETIKTYLSESKDSTEQKLKGAAMATEALIIWVHPFNDGNGRTSRFLGKFIEDGTSNTDQLIAETANKNNRLRMYGGELRVDEYNVYKDQDILLDDDEEAELKQTEMPVADGISLSLKQLMEDKNAQQKVEARTDRMRSKYMEHLGRKTVLQQAA